MTCISTSYRIPPSFYEAKQKLHDFGLGYESIRACINIIVYSIGRINLEIYNNVQFVVRLGTNLMMER